MKSTPGDKPHPLRSWLNELALRNVSLKLVTDDVSHRLISWLNSVLSLNSLVMSVTRDTSQSGASTQPAPRHRAELGSAHPGSVEQHFSPLGTASRHASTTRFSVVGVAAGWPGKRHSESSPFADVSVERTPPAPHNRVAEKGTYPASHVTVHDEPIARASVQLPTAPLDGGDDASQ